MQLGSHAINIRHLTFARLFKDRVEFNVSGVPSPIIVPRDAVAEQLAQLRNNLWVVEVSDQILVNTLNCSAVVGAESVTLYFPDARELYMARTLAQPVLAQLEDILTAVKVVPAAAVLAPEAGLALEAPTADLPPTEDLPAVKPSRKKNGRPL